MSTTGRAAEAAPDASDVAATLGEAGFVRLVARADGDALAGTGLLAGALTDVGVPFQASVARTDEAVSRRLDGTDGQSLAIGVDVADAVTVAVDSPASVTAYDVGRELGADPDPVLALAGAFAAGELPGQGETASVLDAATEAGSVERRPGVAVPTDDPADGLAHSTLVHAAFSGQPEEAEQLVADARANADETERTLASLVAIDATGIDRANERAGTAIERALRPYATPDGPFATLGGYADVLCALAREQPGTGIGLGLGSDGEAALSAWREHARSAHEGLRTATTGRYDGLFVARVEDAPVETVARLLADFRSPEPVAMVVADGEAAAAVRPGESVPIEALRSAADTLGGDASAGSRSGYAAFDGEARSFITMFREAV